MSIEDIKNCECVSFSTSEPMDNIDSAEWFNENILPDDVEITYDDNNYFEVCVEGNPIVEIKAKGSLLDRIKENIKEEDNG